MTPDQLARVKLMAALLSAKAKRIREMYAAPEWPAHMRSLRVLEEIEADAAALTDILREREALRAALERLANARSREDVADVIAQARALLTGTTARTED